MKCTKLMLSIILCSSLIASTYAAEPAQKTDNVQKFLKNPFVRCTLLGAAAVSAASAFALYHNEPKPDFTQRHEWKKVVNLRLLTSKPGEYFKNWKYIVTDWWIGQYLKEKHLVWKQESGIIKQSKQCNPFGVWGNLATLCIVLGKSQKMMKGLAAVGTAGAGIFVAHNPDIFFKFIRGSDINLSDKSGSDKLSLETKVQLRRDLGDTPEAIIADYNLESQLYPQPKPLPIPPTKEETTV